VLGQKVNGEPYAPDEPAAIAQVAHGIGIAIDLLGAKKASVSGEILESLRSLQTTSLAANEALGKLPDAVAERLRGSSAEEKSSRERA